KATEEEIMEFCREHLARFKVPKDVVITEIPKTSTGKLQKFVLREWAKERAIENQVEVNFMHDNLFDVKLEESAYDVIYDSGCFHHIAPHRRKQYIDLVWKTLKPDGHFAITCFVEGGELGGSDITDWEVYRRRNLNGGLGFTPEKLRSIFHSFEEVEIRKMRQADRSEDVFGVSALWTALFKKTD
ncbi:MAG: methyltransferase domain-containing protein, partial [Exiguobacterium mexicanum]